MKLNQREKNRIKYSFSGGNWDKVFTTIEAILEEHIEEKVKLHIDIDEAIQAEITGGEQKRYWADIEARRQATNQRRKA